MLPFGVRVLDASRELRGSQSVQEVAPAAGEVRELCLALLLGVLAAGALLGAGVLAYRRLTGRHRPTPRDVSPGRGLDPALEVFPDDAARRRLRDGSPE